MLIVHFQRLQSEGIEELRVFSSSGHLIPWLIHSQDSYCSEHRIHVQFGCSVHQDTAIGSVHQSYHRSRTDSVLGSGHSLESVDCCILVLVPVLVVHCYYFRNHCYHILVFGSGSSSGSDSLDTVPVVVEPTRLDDRIQ